MKIAIQGHLTRGKEVIQILESLGGKKLYYSDASDKYLVFFINDKGYISCLNCKNPTVKEYHKIYTLEEFEKQFPFKIGDIVFLGEYNDHPYTIKSISIWDDGDIVYELAENELHYTADKLTLYKEMKEERNITLTLDKAKEWYKKGGELKEIALQAFTEKELNSFPRSWEEFTTNHTRTGYYISSDGKPLMCASSGKLSSPHVCPSKKSAEAHLAMIQLEQLRDCWRQGWEPDWSNANQTKYYVCHYQGKFKTSAIYETRRFLSFPTMKMAEEFLECFKDLIEKAGDLI